MKAPFRTWVVAALPLAFCFTTPSGTTPTRVLYSAPPHVDQRYEDYATDSQQWVPRKSAPVTTHAVRLQTRKEHSVSDEDPRPQKFKRKPLPSGHPRPSQRHLSYHADSSIKVGPRINAAEEVQLANIVQSSLYALNASCSELSHSIERRLVGKALASPSFAQLARQLDLSCDASLQRTFQEGLRARDALVAANTGLVYKQVNKYAFSGVQRQDLVQEGVLGLIRAAEKFDPKRGFAFSTYATNWVRSLVGNAAMRQRRLVHIPQTQELVTAKVLAYLAEHQNSHEDSETMHDSASVQWSSSVNLGSSTPSRAEIASALDMPEKLVAQVLMRLPLATQTSISGSYEPTERMLDRAALHSSGEYASSSSSSFSGGGGGLGGSSMGEGWDGVADAQGSQATRRLEADALTKQLKELLTPKEYSILAMRYGLLDEAQQQQHRYHPHGGHGNTAATTRGKEHLKTLSSHSHSHSPAVDHHHRSRTARSRDALSRGDERLASDLMIPGRLRSFGEIAKLMGLTEQQSKYQVNSSIRKLRRVRDVLQPYLGEF